MSDEVHFAKLLEENRRLRAELSALRNNRPLSRVKDHSKLLEFPQLKPLQIFYTPEVIHAILLIISQALHRQDRERSLMHETNMDPQEQRPRCNPAEVLLKLILIATASHFENPGLFDERRMSTILLMGKKVMDKSQRDAEARQVDLSASPKDHNGAASEHFHSTRDTKSLFATLPLHA